MEFFSFLLLFHHPAGRLTEEEGAVAVDWVAWKVMYCLRTCTLKIYIYSKILTWAVHIIAVTMLFLGVRADVV